MAKTIYSAGPVQQLIVEELNAPFVKLVSEGISIKNLGTLRQFLKGLEKLPEPTHEGENAVEKHNSHIMIDLRDRLFLHVKAKRGALWRLCNYGIVKYDYDGYYEHVGDMLLLWWTLTDWQFPSHNNPSQEVWSPIPEQIKAGLTQSIESNYQLLQTRLSTIKEKLGDGEEARIHGTSRHLQFVNRILNDFEREVMLWKK